MTAIEFRSNPALRQTLRELLESQLFQLAKEAVLLPFVGQDSAIEGPEVASVRWLSKRAGFECAFLDLEELTQILPPTQKDEVSDFGEPDAAARLEELERTLPPQYIPS